MKVDTSLSNMDALQSGVLQGVVLAAGRGTRLYSLSKIQPKPLQPICNKPIMQYQLEVMRQVGITEICIVIGPTGEAIRHYFGDGAWLGLHLHYIEDPAPAGIAASLALVEPWVKGPFVVFLGDIFLSLDNFSAALTPMTDGAAGTIIVRRDTPEAIRCNFAVITDDEGRVKRVIEKPANPPTDLKGCGVYVFDGTIFDAIRRTPRSALRNEYEITDAVQNLINGGRPVYAVDIVRWDMNITYPEDLLVCNLRVLREQQVDSLVGQGASVGSEVHLTSSVVGDRSVVDAPVTLSECLVLPDVEVTRVGGVMHRQIFAEGFVWGAYTPVG